MSPSEATTHQSAPGATTPAQAFGIVLDAAVGTVAAKLERKTAGWVDKLNAVAGKESSSDAVVGLADEGLDAVAESGGVAQRAGAEGIKAHVHGESPLWAAVRGVWQGGTPAVRAAVATSVVAAGVLLLLSPALLLVYLLSWLVIAAVSRVRATRQRRLATA
jgi:hypothetical protein